MGVGFWRMGRDAGFTERSWGAHSAAPRHAVGGQEGYDHGGRKDLVTGEFGKFTRDKKQTGLGD